MGATIREKTGFSRRSPSTDATLALAVVDKALALANFCAEARKNAANHLPQSHVTNDNKSTPAIYSSVELETQKNHNGQIYA